MRIFSRLVRLNSRLICSRSISIWRFSHFADPSEYSKAEYILLDPPCSGSGMTNRFNIFGESSSNEDRLFQLATLQSKMLVFALKNFPNAKKLVYSTCSINVEENEQVILTFHSSVCEQKFPDLRLHHMKHL